jgi:hypothetical protein
VGFPIRKSSDQSSFAAPQGLSQRTTSFIASQRQGIHRTPLLHLITLMIDARLHGEHHRKTSDRRNASPGRSHSQNERSDRGSLSGPTLARCVTFTLFTMSNTRIPPPANGRTDANLSNRTGPRHTTRATRADLVEPDGIEPTTSCLQSRRSPN